MAFRQKKKKLFSYSYQQYYENLYPIILADFFPETDLLLDVLPLPQPLFAGFHPSISKHLWWMHKT